MRIFSQFKIKDVSKSEDFYTNEVKRRKRHVKVTKQERDHNIKKQLVISHLNPAIGSETNEIKKTRTR
jgi:hypothetical protein